MPSVCVYTLHVNIVVFICISFIPKQVLIFIRHLSFLSSTIPAFAFHLLSSGLFFFPLLIYEVALHVVEMNPLSDGLQLSSQCLWLVVCFFSFFFSFLIKFLKHCLFCVCLPFLKKGKCFLLKPLPSRRVHDCPSLYYGLGYSFTFHICVLSALN